MAKQRQSRPFSIYLLETALLLQGISGVAGGLGLMMDPSGDALRIPLEWLDGSPFGSYFIPGIILFVVLGVFPLVVLYGIRRRTDRAWIASVAAGAGLFVWIGVEILIIGYQPSPSLQLIYGILGILIVVFALMRPRPSRVLWRSSDRGTLAACIIASTANNPTRVIGQRTNRCATCRSAVMSRSVSSATE